MSSDHSPSVGEEHRRKRVRKGTKSCWECKRRKIKCQLSTENVPVCAGCLARGATCLSQEYPEERDSSGGSNVGERLGRVELLLEKLVSKMNQYEEEENAQKIRTPESMDTTYSTAGISDLNENVPQGPILTLFDNAVIGRRDNNSQTTTPASNAQTSVTRKSCGRPHSKVEKIRQILVDLLPSQEDTDLICTASSCWPLLHTFTQGASQLPTRSTDGILPTSFDLTFLVKQYPTAIARTLIYLAECAQQLPADFDTSRLHILPSVDACIEKWLNAVQTLITSDDEMVGTIEGLECLILHGRFHINAGNLRRSWLTFRRALNVGQLMGLHRREEPGTPSLVAGKQIWQQIIQADRYLGLLLGLPCGAADEPIGPHENFHNPDIDHDVLFTKHLTIIAGRVIDRNQAEYSSAFAATQEIDERLEQLRKEIPESWWEIPTYLKAERTFAAAQKFDRLMSQIWYFQLESLLHLPFMLRAATERRYEYSKFSCLKASREMLYRYFALRRSGTSAWCCKVVDFGAFTASVTLLLGILESSEGEETPAVLVQKQKDRELVQSALASVEEVAVKVKDVACAQAADVMRTLLAVDASSDYPVANLKLTIPYFGTVTIVRTPNPPPPSPDTTPAPLQPAAVGHVNPGHWQELPYQAPLNVNMNPPPPPVVSFTSSQFPPMGIEHVEGWELPGADTLFFDGLLETDIDGNWVF
ncbi:hypothetical protein B7494_g799 [Chlorociboria aeruginascens]|nr:hypothetical protein B7494_g799 [Chlorociboria aeruginascens]